MYVLPAPVEKNTAFTRVTGLRALTSAEGYAILRGKKKKREKKRRRRIEESKKERRSVKSRKKEKEKVKNHLNLHHKEQGAREGHKQPVLPQL